MTQSSTSKRRRLGEREENTAPASQSARIHPLEIYDPDQDENERRWIRKSLRDLTRNLHDYRQEYLQAGNNGILETLQKANEIFVDIKTTTDATVDSHLLVNAADLSYKKSAQLVLGTANAGIDVDEFVSKCISFMRRAPAAEPDEIPSGTQGRRSQRFGGEDDDDDIGDAMNWDWLGREACIPHNARPSLPGFLLGPLSVQKRTRTLTQRRATQRLDASQAVKPQELREEDLDRQETSNLTTMCVQINKLLQETQVAAEKAVSQELRQLEDLNEEKMQEVMDKHNIADDGGIPLFRFCINPRSFGQTVENLFYISFLVRDGTVGISADSRGVPTLHHTTPYAPLEAQSRGVQKHQAVFSLDFETWHDLVEVYDITESIIPHRTDEEEIQRNRPQGWYS
ncbi:hypothetical protein VTN31DRAFT_4818 [Thermomyces dupontii]|uniref:uncharacterized protein n=1 Tax=Talaromyces thermophilus TaxID=28565 RepID=UPI003743DEBD